jgi:FtsZ-binding cell division protein ZapB
MTERRLKKTKETDQMTLTGTEEGEILARLNERVEKAIATIQELRRERDALKERLTRAEDADEEHQRLQRERVEIRNRIETILANLETLDQAE